MDWNEIAKQAYTAYGEVTDFKNFQGNPMPTYEELTPTIQEAWRAAVRRPVMLMRGELPLDDREKAQVKHAVDYADKHSAAGVPGHGQFMLIAKLARRLGL